MKYGRYEIVREVGRGAMGVVYQAHDPHIDRLIALKVLRSDRVAIEASVQRFLKEAKAVGRLSHPNIVTVYDVGQDQGVIYIAMEFLEGRPLSEVMLTGRLKSREVVEIGIQVAGALQYSHRNGVVHRDIKPANIILAAGNRVKLTDFGIARIEDPLITKQTQAGEILGTPLYMSPEQVDGLPVDGRSDLFSLGVILYELSTGKRPFQGESLAGIFDEIRKASPPRPEKVESTIPGPLSDVIVKSLKSRPGDRFQSGEEMAKALTACLEEIVSHRRNGIPPRMQWKGLIIFMALALSVAGGSAWFYKNSSEPPPEPKQRMVSLTSLLQVNSTPAGAQVFLDNSLKGITPVKFELPLGKYEVRLNLHDHFPWEAQLLLDKAGEIPLYVRLIPVKEDASGPDEEATQ
jgi:eukaryotic-like serine/threonine-protein kinase